MLDEVDIKILKILSRNSRERLENISRILKIPISTVRYRIKRLEPTGIIKRYTLEIDYKNLGYSIEAFILI